MAENIQNFRCSGDCLNCRAVNDRRVQWQYCAAQFSYNALRTMQELQSEVKELKTKIDAIQNSEAMVFAPNAENIAQEGDGAEIDAPKQFT